MNTSINIEKIAIENRYQKLMPLSLIFEIGIELKYRYYEHIYKHYMDNSSLQIFQYTKRY
jgi:hypothetical protein